LYIVSRYSSMLLPLLPPPLFLFSLVLFSLLLFSVSVSVCSLAHPPAIISDWQSIDWRGYSEFCTPSPNCRCPVAGSQWNISTVPANFTGADGVNYLVTGAFANPIDNHTEIFQNAPCTLRLTADHPPQAYCSMTADLSSGIYSFTLIGSCSQSVPPSPTVKLVVTSPTDDKCLPALRRPTPNGPPLPVCQFATVNVSSSSSTASSPAPISSTLTFSSTQSAAPPSSTAAFYASSSSTASGAAFNDPGDDPESNAPLIVGALLGVCGFLALLALCIWGCRRWSQERTRRRWQGEKITLLDHP
jgi:hypothetical protein